MRVCSGSSGFGCFPLSAKFVREIFNRTLSHPYVRMRMPVGQFPALFVSNSPTECSQFPVCIAIADIPVLTAAGFAEGCRVPSENHGRAKRQSPIAGEPATDRIRDRRKVFQ